MSPTPRPGTLGRLALRCQPDSRLVALTREGTDPAFEEVVRRYRGRLVAYASGIVRPDRAEDVVQDSLVRALKALRGSDAEITLRPWLHTIVRNRALNDLRDEPALEHLDENFDGVPQPPDVAARKEELAGVVDRVKALPDAQREALVQRELEGRSHEEIAAAMAVTPGAVRGLIFRARSSLRDVAGLAIPMPVLRALVSSSAAAGGGAATVATAGGGAGGLVKLGAAVGVAAVAIGSGVAIHDHGGSGGNEATADSDQPVHRAHHSTQQASSGLGSGAATTSGASSTSASDKGGGQSRSADASGSGHGPSGGGSGGNSGPSPAGGSSGPSPSSGSGSSGGGGDNSGSGGGGGSSGSGEPGDGGGGGTTPSHDGGGDHSGSGDGGGGGTTTTVDGGDGSGSGDGGTSGGGDGGTTTTTTTTTPQPPPGD